MSFLPRPGCPSGARDFWDSPLADTVVEHTVAWGTKEVLGPLPNRSSAVLLRGNVARDPPSDE